MTTNPLLARRILKWMMPSPWRVRLREYLAEAEFHPYPRHVFSRYRGGRMDFDVWLRYEFGYHRWHLSNGRGVRLERPIFLIGCPRSGTSVSVRLFALHPEVANLSEAPEIWDPWHYRDLKADDAWDASRVRAKDAARLHARFEYHRRWEGKPRFVNKHPPSAVRIDYIRAIFPDAVFIHIIRDGRAVALSIVDFIRRRPRLQKAPMPMCRPPNWRELVRPDRLEESALQWRAVVSLVLSKRAELGSAYHEMRYEELCSDPRRMLGAAFRCAGLRVDDEVLARLPQKLESKNWKWKERFSPEQMEMVNRIQGPLLAALGYSP